MSLMMFLSDDYEEPYTNHALLNLQAIVKKKDYHVLSLGGSLSAGINLPHPRHSYPHLLGSKHVTFAPLRTTTGATGPSGGFSHRLCIDTSPRNLNNLKRFHADVVLVEYPINRDGDITVQLSGLETLMQRLRLRFPAAMMMFVSSYVLRTEIVSLDDGRTPHEQQHIEVTEDYHWIGGHAAEINQKVNADVLRIMQSVNGFVYHLPKTPEVEDSIYLFAQDWVHLSQEGHNEMAEGIMNILKDAPLPHKAKNGVWDDQTLECPKDKFPF